MTSQILLVRHGQTEWNRVERFRGRYDIPLNNTGLEQAAKTASAILARWKTSAIYASPLSRAMQTAQAIAEACHLVVQPEEDLLDIDYGSWQGLSPEEARQQWAEEVDNWYHHPQKAVIPGGESLHQVSERAFAAMLEKCRLHPDQQIVLVSHTVVNRLILLRVLGMGRERFWHLRQEPCAINEIEMREGDFILVRMNDTCHLDS